MNLEQLKKIIAEELGLESKKVTEKTTLTEDLGLDSIDALSLVKRIEDDFSIRFDDEKIGTLKTVAEFLKYTNELIKNKK